MELDEKTMLDLGAGTGMLSIAAELFGVNKILAVEIDTDAIEIFKKNIEDF